MQQNITESNLAKIWTCSVESAQTEIYSKLVESTPHRFGQIWQGRPRTKIWSYSIQSAPIETRLNLVELSPLKIWPSRSLPKFCSMQPSRPWTKFGQFDQAGRVQNLAMFSCVGLIGGVQSSRLRAKFSWVVLSPKLSYSTKSAPDKIYRF